MKRIGSVAWKCYAFAMFFFTFLLFYPLYYPSAHFSALFKFNVKLIRFHSKLLMRLCFVKTEVIYNAELPNEPFIVCSNHFSYLDTLFIYCAINKHIVFMAKKELLNVPMFNIFMRRINIPVDRKNPRGSHEAFLKASKKLRMKNNLIIFPEGTIGTKIPKLLPFKNGAFKLSVENKVPIVPVSIINSQNILRDEEFFGENSGSGKCTIVIHSPIFPKDEDYKMENMKLKTQEAISSCFT